MPKKEKSLFLSGKKGRNFRRKKDKTVELVTENGMNVHFGPIASAKIVSIDGKKV